MVTHHERDLPERVDHVLVVRDGRTAFSGSRAAYAQWRAGQGEYTGKK